MLKLKTALLKQMLKKSIKGAGLNAQVARSKLIVITLEDGALKLITTDGEVYLEVMENVAADIDSFYAIVDVDLFSKLINKTTSEDVELKINDTCLTVTGNGSYDFAMSYENSNLAKFPDYKLNSSLDNPVTVSTDIINSMLKTNKQTVCTDTMSVNLVGYYFCPEGVATTNRKTACLTGCDVFSESFMVPVSAVNLLEVVTSVATFYNGDNQLVICSDDVTIYAPKMSAESFPYNYLKNYFGQELNCCVTVNKNELLSIVERLLLFSDKYSNNALELTFADNFLGVRNVSGTGTEALTYVSKDTFTASKVLVNGLLLQSLLKACLHEQVKVYYSPDSVTMLLKFNNVSLLLTTLSTEEVNKVEE